jgi:predicted kinase
MDLEFRGYQRQADEFVSFYLEHALDATLTAVLPFYRVYRACVRGKVDGMQSGEREVPPAQRAAASDRAARYWELAEHMATALPAQTLVVMMGLSGSGKSYLARPLAARMGAVLLSSDVVRHRSRTDQDDRNPLYSKEARDVVYEKMFAEAERYLADGLSVVLDATFLARRHRLEAFQLATLANVPAIVVEVTAAADVVRARMSARDARSASDARWDTYLQQLDSIESSGEVAADQLCQIDGAEALETGIDRALDAIASLHRRS